MRLLRLPLRQWDPLNTKFPHDLSCALRILTTSSTFDENGRQSFSSARPIASSFQELENEEEEDSMNKNLRRVDLLDRSTLRKKRSLAVQSGANVTLHGEMEKEKMEKKEEIPSHITFTEGKKIPVTSTLKIIEGSDHQSGTWPVFRLMDENGQFRPNNVAACQKVASQDIVVPPQKERHDLDALRLSISKQFPFVEPVLLGSDLLRPSPRIFTDTESKNTLLRAHRQFIRLRQMDDILQNAQRQGRISFYMSCRGEEATHIGSASALSSSDVVLAQYREAGLLMWRGFTLAQFMDQCFTNESDLARGRQMPIHYGSRALNYHTISSPLGTQITQAVGVAYRLKIQAREQHRDNNHPSIAIVFFGEGATSTVDFHSGCNFAATLGVPLIFFCRNNGYAISTPTTQQFAGDGVVSRAPGYGMAGIRVDGNDIFAVNLAVSAARSYCLEHNAPVLIEAMTYRQAHHSTSDDSLRYRDADEVRQFATTSDPLLRLNALLQNQDWFTEDDISAIHDEERTKVLEAMALAEAKPNPKISTLFEDVYFNKPENLQKQERELLAHLDKHPGHYGSAH